ESRCSTWRRWARPSRRGRRERCASWDADPACAGSPPGWWAARSSYGCDEPPPDPRPAAARPQPAPAVHSARVLELRADAGHGHRRRRGAAAAGPAGRGRGRRCGVPRRRGAGGAFLQRAPVPVWPRCRRGGARGARRRTARARRAFAHGVVWAARLAGRPARVGGVVAGGFALLWWQRARLTGLRLGLALLAVGALVGWVWP